jgi:hypothetical protein
VYIAAEVLIEGFNEIRLMVCKTNKVFLTCQPSGESRGLVVVGKAVSVRKWRNQEEEIVHKEEREELGAELQQAVERLIETGKYPISKHEKLFTV